MAVSITKCKPKTKCFLQKFLRKEFNKAKLASTTVIPKGQYKQEPSGAISSNHSSTNNINNINQELKPITAQQHFSVNTGKQMQGSTLQQHMQQQQLNKVQQQRTTNFNVTSKTSSIKDSHNGSNNNMVVTMNTGPLVCKNTPPVKRTIQIKPDHNIIIVDINANSGTDEEKPKINGGLSPLNNNNDEDSVDNELSNGDDMEDIFDLSLDDSDCVKSVAAERGRATRNCSNNRKIKAKKTRAK